MFNDASLIDTKEPRARALGMVITPENINLAPYLIDTDLKLKVRQASEYVQTIIDELGISFTEKRSFLPWIKTHQVFAFRPGEVTLWGGVNGHGKSLLTGLSALSLSLQNQRVCIASFEMKPQKTLERMSRQFLGHQAPSPLELMNPKLLSTAKDEFEAFRDWTEDRLWFYDQQGTVKTDVLIAVLKYCAHELGIQHMFIDSLMKCVANEDDYNGQKKFVDVVGAIARDTGMHIHLVHHIKKLESEEKHPNKMDIKGTGAITDQVDNVLILWRNKKKERARQEGLPFSQEEPDALLICDKQRNGEWEGRFNLWYHQESQQFVGSSKCLPLSFYGDFPHRGES